MRIPDHIGIIPDGNRRWALTQGMEKDRGYNSGLNPGLEVFKLCEELGVNEITYYGFTMDNTKRPKYQRLAFTRACVDAVNMLAKENANLLVLGNTNSDMFPKELIPFAIKRRQFGKGGIKVNFLVNYGWQWDLKNASTDNKNGSDILHSIHSRDISRVDLIIRWGGCRRLSGFLPLQSVYSDFYIVDKYWPEFKPSDFHEAIEWYNTQDVTLGG